MPNLEISETTGCSLPTDKSMTQFTIDTLQLFVCCIADRKADELDRGFLKCVTNVLDKLICCNYNYERLAKEAIEDVDGNKIQLLLSFHKRKYGSLNFLDWDDDKVSETISDLISRSPLLSELKQQYDNGRFDDGKLNDIMPIPDNHEIVNIEDVAKTFCEIRNGFLQAYPFQKLQPNTNTEQGQTVKRFSILENKELKELKEIIDESVKSGYAEDRGEYYRWLRSNQLLAYFVQQLSKYLNLSEKIYEKGEEEIESTNWSYFNGIFETKRQGNKWQLADGEKLHDYKRGAMKGKLPNEPFHPKGFEDIDDLMIDFK